MAEESNAATTQTQEVKFNIQRIYTKDISFEAPNSPTVFQNEWKPEIKLDLDTRTNELAENTFEVVLSVTVTANNAGETAFLCEVQQAGIFHISELPPQGKPQMLGAFCPSILFPYARETISNLVNRGSFPMLNLAPVNFDSMLAQYIQSQQAEGQGDNGETPKLDS